MIYNDSVRSTGLGGCYKDTHVQWLAQRSRLKAPKVRSATILGREELCGSFIVEDRCSMRNRDKGCRGQRGEKSEGLDTHRGDGRVPSKRAGFVVL
jgi:hypothetical protein